jgi:hypothetical protein
MTGRSEEGCEEGFLASLEMTRRGEVAKRDFSSQRTLGEEAVSLCSK